MDDATLTALANFDSFGHAVAMWHGKKPAAKPLADRLNKEIFVTVKAAIEAGDKWIAEHPDHEGPDWDASEEIFKGLVAAAMALADEIGDMPFEWRERLLKESSKFIADLVAEKPAHNPDPRIEAAWNSTIWGRG
jgi:hypothetical protein